MTRQLEPELAKQYQEFQLVNWVQQLAPWEVFCTYTWRHKVPYDNRPWIQDKLEPRGVGLWSAMRHVEEFHHLPELRGVSFFTAIEHHKSGEIHAHEMWADCKGVRRSHMWQQWYLSHGRNRIEPIKSAEDVHRYCSKYIMKEGAEWWPDLQWHRQPARKNHRMTLAA